MASFDIVGRNPGGLFRGCACGRGSPPDGIAEPRANPIPGAGAGLGNTGNHPRAKRGLSDAKDVINSRRPSAPFDCSANRAIAIAYKDLFLGDGANELIFSLSWLNGVRSASKGVRAKEC